METKFIKGDIALAMTDAIVNAANRNLMPGTGVCGAIFEGAGIYRLEEECRKIGYCPAGSAVITPGYKLMCKYVIHAVGPIYRGSPDDAKLLKSAYVSSLSIAKEHNLKSIAFPAISTGVYGYPLADATRIALGVMLDFAKEKSSLEEIICYCYDDKTYNMYLKIYDELNN